MTEAMGWRSLLFVPGARPDRFGKALASGADAVCVDLEDAVAPARKDEARAAAIRFLVDGAGQVGPDRVVRINSVRSLAGLRDLLAIAEARPAGGTVAVPKLESAEEVQWIDQVLAEAGVPVRLVAQIETLRGVEQASAIAAASSRLAALMFGGLDLAAELGVPASWDALLLARSRTVHAAARAGLAAIDMPFVDVAAPEGCRAEAVRSLGLGFSAKMAIHPTQVPVINDAYTPSPEEVARAERIGRAYAGNPDGILLLDGTMVERPVVLAMARLLTRARRSGVANAAAKTAGAE